ncbi:nuclear transport factor 2 family protein [Arthrobacter sp. NPDC056493]|uniref:nuclear transport factor 2 family protein n=1 Tax=Arthrobacter sp. NPDC056493 TaxID=3345839 RepID=UPI0036725034
MTTLSDAAPEVLQRYYRILSAGIEAYDPAGELGTLLADDLEFEGPLAGKRRGAQGFCQGVKGFIANVTAIDVIQEVHGPDGSATLYDAGMPGGTVRFAEFFSISDGRITALRIHYDAADYTRKGGR